MDSAVRALFCYAWRPVHSPNVNDGGFSVNLYNDDTLTFTCFDAAMRPVSEAAFALQQGISGQLLLLIDQARLWLRAFPPRMRVTEEAQYSISTLGFDGYPLFRMDDFLQLMDCPFRSMRGHYARMMYNLMEDVSSLLASQGIDLTLSGFVWDTRVIRPMNEPSTQQLRYG